MFGIKHIKFDSMTHIFHYNNGSIKREGRGLSFYYFTPNSSIVAVPMGSNDLPFIFKDMTNDYQNVTVQGQISYKINDPQKLSHVLDFTIDDRGLYKKNDIEKLNQRIINEAQTHTSLLIHDTKLKEALRSAKKIETGIIEGLKNSETIKLLGIEFLGASILSVEAMPEMKKALETETRERLQQEADQAVYERRNFAVEQERKIKESELNTEIAVEEKHKQIAEKKMESNVQRAENERKLREMKMDADIAIEKQREMLLEQKTANDKMVAQTKGYVLETTLKPYQGVDWRTLSILCGNGDSRSEIALAFRTLAEKADKIGNLNITPDLLDSLLDKER